MNATMCDRCGYAVSDEDNKETGDICDTHEVELDNNMDLTITGIELCSNCQDAYNVLINRMTCKFLKKGK